MDKVMAKSDKSGKKKLKVNFTGVETRVLVPEGQHHAKVHETSLEEGDKGPYIKWVFSIVSDDKTNGSKVYMNTSLTPQSLWNLRNLLETLGVETPDSEMELDLPSYIGLELMVRIEHETYEGKDKARVSDFTPLEETASSEADDEETEDEDEEEEDEEEDEKPPAKKPAKKEEPEEETEDEETEDEDEDDDDEGKVSADDVREMDDKELADLVKKHKLKVDLTTIKKASKRVAAVVDALEKKDLLAE